MEAELRQGDLPDLLDALTVAVTTLDAVGAHGFRDLYLYVVGTSEGEGSRDLRLEDGQLIVGPYRSRGGRLTGAVSDQNTARRSALLVGLCHIMTSWKWSEEMTATYLGCSEAMLERWIEPANVVAPCFIPRTVEERMQRLLMVDQARCLLDICDSAMPGWLTARRVGFGRQSVMDMLLKGDDCGFRRVMMWTLNKPATSSLVH